MEAMASGAAATRAMDTTNPCCALWQNKYANMAKKRGYLKEGLEILKAQIDQLQDRNLNLKKECDEERTRANVMEEEKQKEASLRITMEEEIAALKSEISSSNRELVSGNEDLNKEVRLLQTCLSERRGEIDNLKRLLTEEGRRADSEKDHADTERKRVAELQQALACEKSRAEEARKKAAAMENEIEEARKKAVAMENEIEEARKKAAAMENEIAAMKSEILTSGPAILSESEEFDKEVTLLRACISERELEIDRLKQLLIEKEREAGAVRQHADLDREKTAELQEALAYEKCRAEEASKMADDLEKKDEENRVQLETLKNEVEKMRLKCEEAKKKLEAEKQKVIREKKRADEEKTRVVEQRRIAEANEKKVVEESSHANNLLVQLEEKQQNVDKLKKELQEVMSSQRSYSSELDEVKKNLDAEMKKCARERKRADDETSEREVQKKVAESSTKKAIEEKHRADKLSQDLKSSRQRVEYLEKQLHEVKKMLETQRKKALSEEKRADAAKLKSDEQERIAAENGRLATEEKFRADNLCEELENSQKKLQDTESQLHELKSLGKPGDASDIPPLIVNEQTSELQFLQKQLKFEKQRVKHAKEVAELEKDRNIMLQQELFRVRQGVECFLHQLDVLTDIGARNGVNNVSKKSTLSDVHTGVLSKRVLPSLLYPRGDAEFRMSSLSSRDASCQVKENGGFVPAGHHLESPSASFSDEQLVGSQERVAGSLTMSAVLAAEKSNLEATILKSSNGCNKCNDGEKIGTIPENTVRSPVKTTVHATKRRKILVELESIKSMQSEGRRIFEEAEKKLSALHSTIIQPVIEPTEKEKCLSRVCIVNSCSNHDQSNKKRKASHEPEATFPHIDDSSVQVEVGKHEVALPASKKLESSVVVPDQSSKKRKAPHEPETTGLHIDDSSVQAQLGKHEIALSASEGLENSVVLQDASKDIVEHNQDDTSFEELINGDYMKLLNLDNVVDEECFRAAMERPLSPTLPEVNFRDNEAMTYSQMMSVYTSSSHEAADHHGGFVHEKIQLYCIVFSDMEDASTIKRIFGTIRTCSTQCCMFRFTKWLVHGILAVLGLEKDLRPREKVCALFSLILLNFSWVSSRKFEGYQNKELLDSLPAYINSVLSVMEIRSLFEEICHISDLISLFEDFVLHRRIFLQSDAASEHDSSSSFEIVDEGKKYVLSPNVASSDLVMAGSITLASICTAIGHIGSICEVSFNIVRMCGTEDQMTLRILHMFAYLCGQEYVRNSCTFMRVVKSVIIFVENNLASIAGMMDLQSESNDESCFIPCAQCPFSEGFVSLDDVSAMLLEELQTYCLGPPSLTQVTAGQAHLSTSEPVFDNLGDVLSSLELISSKMGWGWACNNIVPKLLKMLELCDRGRLSSTALVALLGELGRLGVKEDGVDDVVETIKCKLADSLRDVDTSKCNAFGMAIVCALVGLHPRYHEVFFNRNVKLSSKNETEGHFGSSTTSEIMRNCLSCLSCEQITSLFGLESPPLIA